MHLSDFDFHLPADRIAQHAAVPRDSCRVMILNRQTEQLTDETFSNIGNYLQPGDVLVFNDSKVLPARLIGKKETGGKAEILLVRQLTSNTWECMVGKIQKAKQENKKIQFSKHFFGTVTATNESTATIRFSLSGAALMRAIMRHGKIPTPPYIKARVKESDYQNVFADPKKMGSVAAPTAGLHFTRRLLAKLKRAGIQIEFVTLHVGLGTFLPVKTNDIAKHRMHSEFFDLSPAVAKRLNKAKREGRRIIPVGTTSLRVLESCATARHTLRATRRPTSIFIYPGYQFKFTDALITNFHTPRSTLLMLVSAFAGKKLIDRAYAQAIKKNYRFYSLGDAMLIE